MSGKATSRESRVKKVKAVLSNFSYALWALTPPVLPLLRANHYAHLLYTPLLSKEGLGEVNLTKEKTSSNSSLLRRRNSFIKAIADLCIMIRLRGGGRWGAKNRNTVSCKITTENFFQLITYNLWPIAEMDIRDIRGPIHIPYSWLWILYAAVGLLIAALLFWIYRFWKSRHQAPVKLPHEIALERLGQALALMKPEQACEFSIAVSDAVRFYIEERFHVHAAKRTTEEFLCDLLSNTSSPLASYSTSLGDFLQHCDLAKFARWTLSIPEMQSMYESARKFIEETKSSEEIQNIESEPQNRPLKLVTRSS